jgi:hypothetical protein
VRLALILLSQKELLLPTPRSRSLTEEIAEHLRLVGGGRFGASIIAPNAPDQFARIVTRLERVQMHPFFQVSHPGGFMRHCRLVKQTLRSLPPRTRLRRPTEQPALLQAVGQSLKPGDRPLATVGMALDRSTVRVTPIGLDAPDAPAVQLFA